MKKISSEESVVGLERARDNTVGALRPALLFIPSCLIFGWWAVHHDVLWAAVVLNAMAFVLVAWRLQITNLARRATTIHAWQSVEAQLLATNWLSCAIWFVAAITLLPRLSPLPAIALVFAMCAGISNAAVHSSGKVRYLLLYSGALALALIASHYDEIAAHPEALVLIALGGVALYGVFGNVTRRTLRLATSLSRQAIARRLWAERSRRRITAAEMRSAAAKSRAAESRALFVARVSHELRTPLQTILAGLELLQQRMEAGPVDPKNRALLERLSRSTDQVLMLSHDLADFVRWESGALPVRMLDVDVPRLVDDIATGLSERARLRGVRLSVEHLGTVGSSKSDAARLRAIITNLLTNAIKYAPAGAVRLATERDASGRVVVTVQDNGPGLPVTVLKVLGSPWVQGENARVQEEGFGLGLSIVMTLSQEVGAKVTVDSSSVGATIRVAIPSMEAQ
jgi:signal transduction histidine kinase